MRFKKQVLRIVTAASLVLALAEASFASPRQAMVYSPVLQRGFDQMYNLDFSSAHATFLMYQHAHPDDPTGYAANAAAYLFSELNRLHVLESDLFIDDSKFEHRSKLDPDPVIKAAFESELTRSDAIVNQALAHNPEDVNALFAQVLANGLRGDYTALIEKRNLASLSYMKTARLLAEKLLAIDPTCYDAYLAVGAENYLLGINPAPLRWILHITGAQTDKQVGLQRLRLTAEKGHYLAPFARLLLAVAALRDKDQQTARVLLAGLAKEFPGNQLYVSELARLQ